MGCSLAFVWDLVALTPHPPQSLLKLRDLSTTQLCSYLDVPAEDFANQIALVARGNCTFYEKVRLAQGSGAHGLLIVSKEKLVPPGGNKTQYEEISIPVALLSHRDLRDIFRVGTRAGPGGSWVQVLWVLGLGPNS